MFEELQTDDKNIIEKGFTLIELLVVIAILGILAAVVVFAVGGITDRGKTSACKAEVSTVQTALEAFNAKNGGYPPGNTIAALNAGLNTDPLNRFLNDPLSGTSPSQGANGGTAYAYTSSGTGPTITLNGNPTVLATQASYAGGTCP